MNYREHWNSKYNQYQQNNASPPSPEEIGRFQQIYSYYLRNWLPQNKNLPILEVACGSGKFLCMLRDNGYSDFEGIDSSPQQIELSKKQGLEVTQANALEYMKDCNKIFEAIIALDFFEHLYKDEALHFLDAAFQRLKPGGRLILQTPNGESPWVGSVFHGDFTHEICYTPHLLEKLLKQSGFENIKPRPCGPPPVDFISSARKLTWDCMTLVCKLLNKIEGAVSSGIYTRVFLISGTKPH